MPARYRHSTCFVFIVLIVAAPIFGSAAGREPASGNRPPISERQITAVAFSPDGGLLAAGGYRTITVFDGHTGRELTSLFGSAGPVTSIAFSRDGHTLAAASGQPAKSGEVRMWHVSGSPAHFTNLPTLTGPSDTTYSIAFSPDGRLLAGGSYDRSVCVWATASQGTAMLSPKPKRVLRDHTDAVYAVAFSPDGRLLASASGDRTVKLWDPATGRRLYTLSESLAELYTVAFSPNGKQLAAGGADRTLRTWNVTRSAGSLAKSAFAHQAAILRLTYARDGGAIYTTGEDNAIKRWDSASLEERKSYPAQPDWPQGLALSPDGLQLAVGTHNGTLEVYDTGSGKLLRTPLRAGPVASAAPTALPTTSSIPGRRLGDNTQRRPVYKGGVTVMPASLSEISPRGAPRGSKVRLTLKGARIADATGVVFDDPAIQSAIAHSADKNDGVLSVDAEIGASTRIGVHHVFLQTPHGTTESAPFAVGGWPEVMQAKDGTSLATATQVALPCTAVGVLASPGDSSYVRVDA